MKIHCPQCGKRFQVQHPSEELSGETHFICTTCDHEFSARWHPHTQALQVLTTESGDEDSLAAFALAPRPSPKPSPKRCPACEGLIESFNEECPHCLKIPAKVLAHQKTLSPQKPEADAVLERVKSVWRELLEHFNDPEAHQHFIALCEKLEQLDFAEDRFRQLQKMMGDDPEVVDSLQRIAEARLRLQNPVFQSQTQLESGLLPKQQWKRRMRQWQVRLILFIIGGTLFLLGGLGPAMRFTSFVGVFIIIWLLLDGIKK